MVDDNIQMTTLFKQYFKSCNINMDCAVDGKAGLKMVVENKYDMIVMDINMPEVNGVEATRMIRELEVSHRNYICAFTAYPEQLSEEEKKLFDNILAKNEIKTLRDHVLTILKEIKN